MNKGKDLFLKIVYAVGANIIGLLVSVVTTLLIPKVFCDDILQYGYLQIFLFYVNYIGFFHLGWCDGIYLRDGGKDYSELDKPKYATQFWMLVVLQVFFSFVIMLLGFFVFRDSDYRIIVLAIAINILIANPRTMLAYYLQTTNRIKEYSAVTVSSKLVLGTSILVFFFCGVRDYKLYVLSYILCDFVSLLVGAWWCRDILLSKIVICKQAFCDAAENVSVGVKLLFANIANMLITGIVRVGIQTQWDVATYGKISFTLSVCNLLLTFVSAIALVLYPSLRRVSKENLGKIYNVVGVIVMTPVLGLLILYYPVELILANWLPQYADSLRYMAIVFPMCIYAIKMTLLIQTYMNVYRLEKQLLKVNLFGVIFALCTTILSVYIFRNLSLAMMSIVLNQMFRCIYAELVLKRYVKSISTVDIVLEMLLTFIFIISSWLISGWCGVVVYAVSYVIYLLYKRKDIARVWPYIKGNRA